MLQHRSSNVLRVLTFIAYAGFTVLPAHAGPLNPPAGPITSTNKPLADVEPRTAINSTNTPGDADSLYRITQPGSYYLTGNLTGTSGKHGIEIAASRVTIDLSGFAVNGVAGSLDGITTEGLRDSATIRNGTIAFWGSDGVNLTTGGVGFNGRVEQVTATGNGASGIHIGLNGSIRDCIAEANIGSGFTVSQNGLVTGCTARNNDGYGFDGGNGCSWVHCSARENGLDGFIPGAGSSVADCASLANAGNGFVLPTGTSATNCAAVSNTADGFNTWDGCTLQTCTAYDNGNDGIEAGAGATITGCAVMGNSAHGIRCALGCTITTCTSTDNSEIGILCEESGTITNCTTRLNASYGIAAGVGSTVNNNSARGNSGDGIRCTSSCLIRDNMCYDNNGSGVFVSGSRSRIEGNNCTFVRGGITADGPDNIIFSNTCGGNSINWVIDANNIYGPIIDRIAVASPSVGGDSAVGVAGSTDPHANFSY